jgi:hypothetical protein
MISAVTVTASSTGTLSGSVIPNLANPYGSDFTLWARTRDRARSRHKTAHPAVQSAPSAARQRF